MSIFVDINNGFVLNPKITRNGKIYKINTDLNNTLQIDYVYGNLNDEDTLNFNKNILSLWFPLTREVVDKLPDRYKNKNIKRVSNS